MLEFSTPKLKEMGTDFHLTVGQCKALRRRHVGNGVISYLLPNDVIETIAFCTDRRGRMRTMDGSLFDIAAIMKEVVEREEAAEAT